MGLQQVVEPGTITWAKGGDKSTIDLAFVSQRLCERLVACEVAEDVEDDSDHNPIRTLVDIETPETEPVRRRNWKQTDAKELKGFVDANLMWRSRDIRTKEHIEQTTDHLVEVLRQGIERSTPWARPSAYSNPDFTPRWREAVKKARQLRRRWKTTGTSEDWEAYAKARNQKGRIVSKDLQQGHRKRVEDVTKSGTTGLWRLAKWARTRGQAYDQGTIPTLEVEEENGTKTLYKTPEERARIFQKVFFPEPPPADLSDIPDAEYPQDIEFPVIEEWEVEQAVRKAPAYYTSYYPSFYRY